jgi:uncharacterized protein YndB with AHSA1/START domain
MKPAKEPSPDSSSLTVHYRFDAARTEVFNAFTDPVAIKAWFVPTPGFSVTDARVELRVGGAFRYAVTTPRRETNHIGGIYKEVDPPARLVFTWRWEGALDIGESIVTVEFRALGNATEVVITHDGLPNEQMINYHRFGWESALEALAHQL